MKKEYICVANGYSKENNNPYSRFCAVVSTNRFNFLNPKDTFTVPEICEFLSRKVLTDGEED